MALLPVACLFAGGPEITIYRGGIGMVRESLNLDLHAGLNPLQYRPPTQIIPESVVLRDVEAKQRFRLIEQDYVPAATADGLLAENEGATLDFLVREPGQAPRLQSAKIVRAPRPPSIWPGADWPTDVARNTGNQIAYSQGQVIIEVDGRWQFTLPGQPVFPARPEALFPALAWKLTADQPGKAIANLSYLSRGLNWKVDYTAIKKGDSLEFSGWLTIDNRTGLKFSDASVCLSTADAGKFYRPEGWREESSGEGSRSDEDQAATTAFRVLDGPVTIDDQASRQFGFASVADLKTQRLNIYEAFRLDPGERRQRGSASFIEDSQVGTISSSVIRLVDEVVNASSEGLGRPLPGGRVRIYERGADGSLDWLNEDQVDFTPENGWFRIPFGAAPGLKGSRVRTDFKVNQEGRWADESFSINLRNGTSTPAEIRVVENLFRGGNWSITESSNTFLKIGDRSIEFRVSVKPGEEKKLTYTVHYSW
ncbi:MAG: hypothetical protein PHC88_06065 [Terrimicrobiaceae bacterium]|nr:hypothetical protein [Terrimicrobiaceae bacterium]